MIAGTALLRIDIPECSDSDGKTLLGFTQFYGPSSIYCLMPVTEEIARRYTSIHRERPVQHYELPQLEVAKPESFHHMTDQEDELEEEKTT